MATEACVIAGHQVRRSGGRVCGSCRLRQAETVRGRMLSIADPTPIARQKTMLNRTSLSCWLSPSGT
jgi:hypothetical protein